MLHQAESRSLPSSFPMDTDDSTRPPSGNSGSGDLNSQLWRMFGQSNRPETIETEDHWANALEFVDSLASSFL